MTTIFRFLHDPCGYEAQIMHVYYRTEDQAVLIEGVCVRCSEGFVRNYQLSESHEHEQKMLTAPQWTDEDMKFLKKFHIRDAEAA